MKVVPTTVIASYAANVTILWQGRSSIRWEESWCVNHAIMISTPRFVRTANK